MISVYDPLKRQDIPGKEGFRLWVWTVDALGHPSRSLITGPAVL